MSTESKTTKSAIVAGVIGITAEMIAEAKAKHGEDKVRILSLPLDDANTEYKDVLAVVPSRRTIGMYQRYADSDPYKAQEILVKACLLSHKDEVIADDGLFFGALNLIAKLIPVREGIIKNC